MAYFILLLSLLKAFLSWPVSLVAESTSRTIWTNFREAIGLVHLLKAYPKGESQRAGIVRKGYKVVCNIFEDCCSKKDNFACSVQCLPAFFRFVY
jgi:hypothetical protein